MIAASISAMVFAGPRVYFAMAQHGLFFDAAARVHPRFRTPAVAIVAQGVWSCLLVLSGTFGQLIDYTGFAVVLFTGVAVMALFVLRRRLPSEPRPFKAWGYPVAPFVYAVGSMLIVANAIWRQSRPVRRRAAHHRSRHSDLLRVQTPESGPGARARSRACGVTVAWVLHTMYAAATLAVNDAPVGGEARQRASLTLFSCIR